MTTEELLEERIKLGDEISKACIILVMIMGSLPITVIIACLIIRFI